MIAIPKENAQGFVDKIEKVEGWPAWIIGDVSSTSDPVGKCIIVDDPKIIEV